MIDGDYFIAGGHDGDSGGPMDQKRCSADHRGQTQFDRLQVRSRCTDDVVDPRVAALTMNGIATIHGGVERHRFSTVTQFVQYDGVQDRARTGAQLRSTRSCPEGLRVAHGSCGNESIHIQWPFVDPYVIMAAPESMRFRASSRSTRIAGVLAQAGEMAASIAS